MGKMKIHTNPDGADFDFSGGDLHVDLHPAHSDVFPIYNYFHSDYHDDHHEEEEEEHHMEPFHEMHHGSGGGRHIENSVKFFHDVIVNLGAKLIIYRWPDKVSV